MRSTVSSTIKAIIFDFGGVLLRTYDHSYRTRWDDKLGLAHGQFEDYIFNGPVGRMAQLGQATWDEVWQEVAQHFNLSPTEIKQAKDDFFKGDRFDEGLADYIRRLKERYTIGLLSNTWLTDGFALLSRYSLVDAFDVAVTSAELGVMKPDPRIYRAALERAQAQPEQAIFIDDSAPNIVAARDLGMHTVHFVDPVEARMQLATLTGVT